MHQIGGKGVVLGENKIWTNSIEIMNRLRDECHQRKWMKDRRITVEEKKFISLVQEGVNAELNNRESLGEVNLIESREAEYQNRGILVIEEDEKFTGVYHVDSFGEFHDEITGKFLPKSAVLEARLEEMRQVQEHKVYEKVPFEEGWNRIGKDPIKTRWLDINKGDEDNPEYRSRLVVKEIKADNRLDLFAATPPLEAKKLILS